MRSGFSGPSAMLVATGMMHKKTNKRHNRFIVSSVLSSEFF
jgi:hypothetical protein